MIATETEVAPESFLGISHENPEVAIVCAWCPSKAEGDKFALLRCSRISHAICPQCAERLLNSVS